MDQEKVKKGYKQTEVGVIPEDWDVKTAAEICVKIQDGTHFSPTAGGSDFLYVTSKNIGFGFLDVSDAERIDAEQHRSIYNRCDVKKGDLLLTKDGANTGNAALNHLDEEFSLLSSVAFLRFDVRRYAPGYFLQQILSHSGQSLIKGLMSGNAITRLTLEKINGILFSVPSFSEQQAIAAALRDVDELISGLDRLIYKKHAIKQGAMQELLTGKRRLPGFRGEWEVKRLADIAPLQRGFDLPSAHLREGKYPVVYSNGVQNRHSSSMAKGPGVITGRSGTIGKVSFVEEDYWPHNTALWVTDFKSNSPKFVYFLYTFIGLERFSTGSGVPTLNRNDVHAYQVAMPSTLDEQISIEKILTEMDDEMLALEKKREKTQLLKQGMMQALLTGRIRLVDPLAL